MKLTALGLMIGNSRHHWADFREHDIAQVWDSDPVSSEEKFPPFFQGSLPLYLASVVPETTVFWQSYPQVKLITLKEIPLHGVYPSLGIDRALAVWGAGTELGWPILVIDGGTALTFTGADQNRCLVGGAILPGLGLQLSSLTEKTAALPRVSVPQQMPERWALSTESALQSGVIYTVLSGLRDFIQAWRRDFPQSQVVITGGDRVVLQQGLQQLFPDSGAGVLESPYVIFWGMLRCQIPRQ